jgi:hypothetical protein
MAPSTTGDEYERSKAETDQLASSAWWRSSCSNIALQVNEAANSIKGGAALLEPEVGPFRSPPGRNGRNACPFDCQSKPTIPCWSII